MFQIYNAVKKYVSGGSVSVDGGREGNWLEDIYETEIEYGKGGAIKAKEIIMNKIGWSEPVADYFVGKSEKFAVWLADSILKEELEIKNLTKGKLFNTQHNGVGYINAAYGQVIRGIIDWLQHPLTEKQNLRNLTLREAVSKADQWHNELTVLGGDIDFVEPKENIIIKQYPKNDEGVTYYWVLIPSNFCSLESSRMGHCGRTGYGNKLISLRSNKPYGKGHTISDSHVTIAYSESDGIFYQVKGKKNNKPAEKYHPYIFDLIVYLLENSDNSENLSGFGGFGSEYGHSEDYGFEDMTEKQLKEIFDIDSSLFKADDLFKMLNDGVITKDELEKIYKNKPELFSSIKSKVNLFDYGITESKPSFVVKIEEECKYVSDLLRIDRDTRDSIVEDILCGDMFDYISSSDYYYDNVDDLIDYLDSKNEEEIINEIVRITGLEKSVVEENGIEHYLTNEDEDFSDTDFENIKMALSRAAQDAEQSDFHNYLYKELKSSLSELGEVVSLNDEGVVLEINLQDYLTIDEISQYAENLDSDDLKNIFSEALSDGSIEKPYFGIDSRYSPSFNKQEFNEILSGMDLESGYEKGGSIKNKFSKGGKIDDSQINVGNRFGLINGEVIEIKKRYIDPKYKGDDRVVVFTRSSDGKEHENTVNTLRIFLKNTKAQLINKHTEEVLGEKYWTKYAKGGSLYPDMTMVKSDVMKLKEYAKKISDLIEDKDDVEAWVISKISKVEQTTANVKHTLEVFKQGGKLEHTDSNTIQMMCLHIGKYANSILEMIDKGVHFDSWMKHELAIAGNMIDSVYHYLDFFYAGNKLAKGGNVDDYTKSLGMVVVKFANPKYNYSTSVSGSITEKEARDYFVGKSFNVAEYPKENFQKVIDIDFHEKGTYKRGGTLGQRKKVEKVMREFKMGKLKTHGKVVTDRGQAIAIALSEAGLSKKEDGGIIGSFRLPASDVIPIGEGGIPTYNTPLDHWDLYYEKGGKLKSKQ